MFRCEGRESVRQGTAFRKLGDVTAELKIVVLFYYWRRFGPLFFMWRGVA